MLGLIHLWGDKLAIKFEDDAPFRRFENNNMGHLTYQHYALRVDNTYPFHRFQDGLKVILVSIGGVAHSFNLPIELRYQDRSNQKHYLNPDNKVFIDVLSFEISVEEGRRGFFINFHGDNNTDYSMPCVNCTIQIDISSSVAKPITKLFQIGLRTIRNPTAEDPNHRQQIFFMREATQ